MKSVGIYEVRYNKSRKPHLVKVADTQINRNTRVDKPEVAWRVFETAFLVSMQSEEYVYLMCCDSKMYIIGLFIVSHGNVKGAMINMSGIFQRALLCNAAGIIVAHNHPSGISDSSLEDREVFDKLKEACKLMEVDLQDCIILGSGNYLSFRKEGLFT